MHKLSIPKKRGAHFDFRLLECGWGERAEVTLDGCGVLSSESTEATQGYSVAADSATMSTMASVFVQERIL